jgi:hypothetical protein
MQVVSGGYSHKLLGQKIMISKNQSYQLMQDDSYSKLGISRVIESQKSKPVLNKLLNKKNHQIVFYSLNNEAPI